MENNNYYTGVLYQTDSDAGEAAKQDAVWAKRCEKLLQSEVRWYENEWKIVISFLYLIVRLVWINIF